MILDNLASSHCDYGSMDGRLARAFEWLKAHDLASLQTGQVVTIDGSRIKAQIQEYETIAPEQGAFEVHRAYADIQIMVKGCETMQWTPLSRLTNIKTPYNYEKDLVFFEEPVISSSFLVEEGNFCVFFPTDGHKPRCMVNQPEMVKKIVVKVAV